MWPGLYLFSKGNSAALTLIYFWNRYWLDFRTLLQWVVWNSAKARIAGVLFRRKVWVTSFTFSEVLSPRIHTPSIHPCVHAVSHESSSLSVECLLHLPAQPGLVWGDLRGEMANPNFEHESASRGKASWILSLFLMIMVQSVWPEWWKCQPAYLSGTAWRWGGRPVRKTTRTHFEIRRVQLSFLLASYSSSCAFVDVECLLLAEVKTIQTKLRYDCVCRYLHLH